jgi:hypothetical protein
MPMATLVPTRNSCLPRMTGGEKRFSERLETKLEDDYLLWYDVPVGLKQRRPDFVVFHPRRGLLVLEVKDWKAETIQHADRTQFTLLTDRGLVKEANPLLQARAYALEIGVVLERDPALRYPASSRYAGKLVMPWAWGGGAGKHQPQAVRGGRTRCGNPVAPGHLPRRDVRLGRIGRFPGATVGDVPAGVSGGAHAAAD